MKELFIKLKPYLIVFAIYIAMPFLMATLKIDWDNQKAFFIGLAIVVAAETIK